MMHTTCLNSLVSLRCTPSRSLYFDDRFETNPLLISSSFGYPSCCCCCCAARCHSIYNSLPRTNPSFLCNGLRQSTLIQFSLSKRLIVSGSWRQLCTSRSSRFSSGSESDRIRKYCYKKVYGFDERRKLGNSRYGRYARWSYDDKKNGQSFSDESEDDYGDDVELLLDLLTEEVGLENVVVRDNKRIRKKDSSKISGRIKSVKSGSVKRDLKCDTKAAEVRSREKENKILSNERRKQGSSCSSYYSVSSTGEYDSENDVVAEHDDYYVKGEYSGEYKDDRKSDSQNTVYDEELEENVERRHEFGEKESEILKKNAVESYFGNQEWRKKSEKKLNVESSQSQHTDRISQSKHTDRISSDRITGQYQSGMKSKNSSIQKRYSDTENKVETADFTRQNEYKTQSNVNLEASVAYNFDKRKASSSSLFETRMKNREETADFTRQNEYKKQSNVILGDSEVRNFDKRNASSSSFETKIKQREEDSTQVSGRSEVEREEEYQRVDQLTSSKESRVRSQHSEKTDRITAQSQSRLNNNNSSTSVQELTSYKEEAVDLTRQNEYKKQSNVVLEASKTHNFDNRIASSSSSSFETRMKNREEHSTQVSDRVEDEREEIHQRVDQTTSSKDSRLRLQQISEISDTHFTNIENTSVSRTQSDTRTNNQETHLESSSSSDTRQNIEDKYSSSQAAAAGPTESTKPGRKTTKASSFNVGMPREAPSSYKALKLNPETSFQETGARIASADEQQKSAGQIVGEFVEKAKHQLSVTEGEPAYDDSKQHELKSSGDNGSGNYDDKDGVTGPSDEMWHESGPGPTSDEPVKRTGRSLWNVIGDVVRLRWGPSRSETQTPKSGGVSNQSTSSEGWFSGHEPDESSRKDVSTPSSSKDKQESPLLLLSSSSKSMSPIRMRRSPAVKTTSVTGETEALTSGQSDQIAPKPLTQVPQTDASGSGKIVITEPPPVPSRRKLARTDQVSKDRFDEWEEAYTIESKQRKNDEFFMREALTEAKKAADLWEVPVGAVLVQDGTILARGYNLVEELRDSTAHAEMVCIREASNKLHSWKLSGTTLYVTLEPCPMCAGAILQARIDTVVWGAPNKLLGADGSWIRLFPDGDGGNGSDKPPSPVHPFHPNMIVRRGVLSLECADAMQQFFQLRRKKKDKKPEDEPPSPPPPSSCLPVTHHHHHHSKLVTKLHDAFNIMFCL
ncbi:uncharacterized protein LOC143569116 [Bidens hawaiensis]|uniref:uncharacterized protein LOC143569116 n=1 Tax=Bidens hawaiensis TaxID=980011 RepID=UPI00404AFAA9